MNLSLRLSLSFGASAAALVGLSFLLSQWSTPAAAEVVSPPAAQGWIDGWQLSDDLDARLRIALYKIDVKRQLTRELLAGRLTLLETAARYRALDRAHAGFVWNAFRRELPGRSDDERHCRMVIAVAEGEVSRKEAPAVVARLTAELDDHLKRGPISLAAATE